MSKRLDSYVEVVIPHCRLGQVQDELKETVRLVGGITLTLGMGGYVSDDGTYIQEHVATARWEMNLEHELTAERLAAIRKLVDRLLVLGEESVLRRRYYHNPSWIGGYRSELIYKPAALH